MAAASEVDIANRALSKLGDARITALTDDTKGARAMNHRFDFLRDEMQASYPWRFCMEIESLPAASVAPAWGYARRFLLPSNCLRLVTLGEYQINVEALGVQYRVGGSYAPSDAPFEVFGKYIHTDFSAPLKIVYIKQITDTTEFPDVFVEALASRLAYDAAEELTQSAGKADRALRDMQAAIREARRIDALQRPPGRRAPGRWMMSRYG